MSTPLDSINPRHYKTLLRCCKTKAYAFGKDPKFVMQLREQAMKHDKNFLREKAKRMTPAMHNAMRKVSADGGWWPWQEVGRHETVSALLERGLIEVKHDSAWNVGRIDQMNNAQVKATPLGRALLGHLARKSAS